MSNYIMDLRKVVGHAHLLQAAASIIIENENGQVLLEKWMIFRRIFLSRLDRYSENI